MPIYMDIHHVPGAEAKDLAEAHRKDMLIQAEYQCKCMTYWIDEARGTAFCLIEAPDQAVVEEMHKEAHGFMPNKIIEVSSDIVQGFLGRIHDPEEATTTHDGLKIFSDKAFRFIFVTATNDPVLLRHNLGKEKAGELLTQQNDCIRNELSVHGGRRVEMAGKGFIASFTSATKAMDCALEIQRKLSSEHKETTGLKIIISAGEPVANSNKIFGDVIQQAENLFTLAKTGQVMITAAVTELLSPDYLQKRGSEILVPPTQDESFVREVFSVLEKHCQDSDFSVIQFCRAMCMSKSQLYRKTIALWNITPNQLLQEYRLNNARELLRVHTNISQTTFDSGFTSPSYFTKCFKKKFGLLPSGYIDSLQ